MADHLVHRGAARFGETAEPQPRREGSVHDARGVRGGVDLLGRHANGNSCAGLVEDIGRNSAGGFQQCQLLFAELGHPPICCECRKPGVPNAHGLRGLWWAWTGVDWITPAPPKIYVLSAPRVLGSLTGGLGWPSCAKLGGGMLRGGSTVGLFTTTQ